MEYKIGSKWRIDGVPGVFEYVSYGDEWHVLSCGTSTRFCSSPPDTYDNIHLIREFKDYIKLIYS